MVNKIWDDPEVYQIPVSLPQNPLRVLNSYVIKTPEQNLIIDTGFNREECRNDLFSGLEELGLDFSKTALFLTHVDSDHTGLVCDFADRGMTVYMGRKDYEHFVEVQTDKETYSREAMFVRDGYPEAEMARQATENQGHRYAPSGVFKAQVIDDGDSIPLGGVEAIAINTPGHSPGHMTLYLPKQQVLFSGDHILFDITPVIGVWHGDPHPLASYVESLQKIKKLPIKACFPGHRAWNGNVYERIGQLIEHHNKRLDEIYQAIKAAPKEGISAYDVAGHITWSARGLGWAQFPPNQRWFAVSETLSHVYYLLERGQIVRIERDGKYFYRCSDQPEAQPFFDSCN